MSRYTRDSSAPCGRANDECLASRRAMATRAELLHDFFDAARAVLTITGEVSAKDQLHRRGVRSGRGQPEAFEE